MTKWGNAYCKGQLRVITKKEQEPLKSGTGNLLQSFASLLQSRASITNQGNFITKWGNYYKVGEYKAYK